MPDPGKQPTRVPRSNGDLSVDWSNLHPSAATCNPSFAPSQCPSNPSALAAVCISRAASKKSGGVANWDLQTIRGSKTQVTAYRAI